MIFPVKRLADLGYEILATEGTASVLRRHGVIATVVRKHTQGAGPDGQPTIVTRILAGEVDLVVNTPHGVTSGGSPRVDGYEIRSAAVSRNIPCITTVQGLSAVVQGVEALRLHGATVRSLQEWAPSRAPGRPTDGAGMTAAPPDVVGPLQVAARWCRGGGSAPTTT